MSNSRDMVFRELIEGALEELSDAEFQQNVWVIGSPVEVASMTEAVAALFDDSGLGLALEKGGVVFTQEADSELRELRKILGFSLLDERKHGTAAVINSPKWRAARDRAARVLKLLRVRH